MCRGCRMTPADEERVYARQGAVDAEDFYKETNYKTSRKTIKRKPKKRGCEGNDYGPHVYVWTTNPSSKPDSWPNEYNEEFRQRMGFYRYEYKVCAGCLRRVKYRYTEEMLKYISNYRR